MKEFDTYDEYVDYMKRNNLKVQKNVVSLTFDGRTQKYTLIHD